MKLVEVNPAVQINGRPQKEGTDYDFQKSSDRSFTIFLKKQQISIRVAPTPETKIVLLKEPKPKIYIGGVMLQDFQYTVSYLSYPTAKVNIDLTPGISGIRRITLIPIVMSEEQYNRTNEGKKKFKEERSTYEKEHGYLWK